MITARGWAAAAVGLAFPLFGRLLGIPEFYELGAASLAALAACMAYRFLIRHRIEGTRGSRVTRGAVGVPVSLNMTLVNRSVRTCLPASLSESAVTLGSLGTVYLQGLRPGESANTSLTFIPRFRGRWSLRPATLTTTDPFGLSARRSSVGGEATLIVYPRTERLLGPPKRIINEVTQRAAARFGGSDFHSIREYIPGDSLKRVHWGSTARKGQLMIRQLRQPREFGIDILVDRRPSAYEDTGDPDLFEKVVSSAASLARHYSNSGFNVRLANQLKSSDIRGAASALERLFTALAVIELDQDEGQQELSKRLSEPGDLLILVTCDLTGVLKTLVPARVRNPIPSVIVHQLGPDSAQPGTGRIPGVSVLSVPAGGSISGAWEEASELKSALAMTQAH